MTSTSLYNHLINSYPESDLPWIITALRQDETTWKWVDSDESIKQIGERIGKQPADWSPGNLALLALNTNIQREGLRADPKKPLEKELRQLAYHAFESITKVKSSPATQSSDLEHFSPPDLLTSGLLALALRERQRLIGAWSDFSQEILNRPGIEPGFWRTPLACLYAYIPEPLELLKAFIRPNSPRNEINLALHAFLSNPMPENERGDLLQTLVENLLAIPEYRLIDVSNLLSELSTLRPVHSQSLANWLLTHDQFDQMHQNVKLSTTEAISLGEIYSLAGQPEGTLQLIDQERSKNRWMEANLAALWAITVEALTISDESSASQNTVMKAWEEAVSLSSRGSQNHTPSPFYTNLVHAQLQASDPSRRKKFLTRFTSKGQEENSQEIVRADLLLAMAQAAYQLGDMTSAQANAVKALKAEKENAGYGSGDILPQLNNQLEQLRCDVRRKLSFFLSDICCFQESNEAACLALADDPNDVELLNLLGKNHQELQHPEESIEYFRAAVLLSPSNLDQRIKLAEILESNQDWSAALVERQFIAGKVSPQNLSDVKDALLNLATCALQNNQTALVKKTCQDLVSYDPEEGGAYALLGLANALEEDFDSSQQAYSQAVLHAPHLPEAWIGLAKAQSVIGSPVQVLETLNQAVQAAPQSYEIHFELGKNLLSGGSLTQAHQSLEKAYELLPANLDPEIGKTPPEEVVYQLSQVLTQLGHKERAHAILAQAFTEYPSAGLYSDLPFAYAKSLIEMGQTCTAIPVLRRILQSKPDKILPYMDFARIVLSNGEQPQEALEALQHVLEMEPCYDEAQALVAEAYSACRDYPNAMRSYQKALETSLVEDPVWFARLSSGVGSTALELGETETAIASLQEAVNVEQSNPTYHRQLSEAYWKADLFNNALQSARAALNLDSANPDLLKWFVDKAIQFHQTIISPDPNKGIEIVHEGSSNRPAQVLKPRQLLLEALNALEQAAELAPQRAELYVRMTELHILIGDTEAARIALQKITEFDDLTPQELMKAAKLSTKINDNASAVSFLERAVQAYQNEEQSAPFGLLQSLSQAYISAGARSKAVETWKTAIHADPLDVQRYLQLADTLVKIGEVDQAQRSLNESLEHLTDTTARQQIYSHSACLDRSQGKLREALEHMHLALNLDASNRSSTQLTDIQQVKWRLEIAELNQALLDFHSPRLFLEESISPDLNGVENHLEPNDLKLIHSYYTLKSELALDAEEEIDAAHALTLAVQIDPAHARTLALQARFQYRQRDEDFALATLQEAVRNISESNTSPEILLGVSEAARELEQWDLAFQLQQQVVKSRPAEPLSHFNLARTLVLQAERQHLCQALDIFSHAPGKEVLDLAHEKECFQSLTSTEHLLNAEARNLTEDLQPEIHGSGSAYDCLHRWALRAQAAFLRKDGMGYPTQADYLEELDHCRDSECRPDELAALLAARARQLKLHPENPSEYAELSAWAEQAMRQFPQHALVLLNAVLALSQTHHPGALQAAQQAASQLSSTHKSTYMFSLGLLAKIAHQSGEDQLAIQAVNTALKFWQEEPRWHALAASLSSPEISLLPEQRSMTDQLTHLEKAVQLEPEYLPHHLNLGKFLLQASRQDESLKPNAFQVLEKACQLAPREAEPWLSLAQAYFQEGESGLDQATRLAERAVSLAASQQDQGYLKACLLAGETTLLSGNPKVALRYADQALKVNASDISIHVLKAKSLDRLGQPEEALATLESIQDAIVSQGKNKENLLVYLKIAELTHKIHGSTAALKLLKPLEEENPDEPKVLALMAKIMDQVGETEAASLAAQSALKANTAASGQFTLERDEKADIHHLVGKISNGSGQLDNAIHHLNEAIRIRPDEVEPYLELGFAYQKQRQFLKAQKIFQQATKVAPQDARTFVQAGLALKEGKDYATAETMLKRAAQLAPNDVQIRKHLAAVAALNLVHNPRNRIVAES